MVAGCAAISRCHCNQWFLSLSVSLSPFFHPPSLFLLLLWLFYFHKHQPDMGSTKPNSAKSRPSTLSTNGEATSAKRPSPTTANKKSPVPKATTPTAAKRPPMATGSAKAARVSIIHMGRYITHACLYMCSHGLETSSVTSKFNVYMYLSPIKFPETLHTTSF